MLEIGSVLDGKYRILDKIGQGGMSVVYLARNERANKTWAVKEVRKNGSTAYDVVKQGLIAETNILKRLNNPHLPSIIDILDDGDSFIIVMDYIEGVGLDKRLENGPQPEADVIEWGKQLCEVLHYLHTRKPKPIIYRDMKPANVMLRPDGQIMLLDFGTAREYKSNKAGDDTTCLGTKGYAAPEQYGGMGQTDARTDIYCLGATMYHLVTGRNPSLPPYEMLPIRKVNPKLSRGLQKIIQKCTRPNPDERYQSCLELMYDLAHVGEIDDGYRKKLRSKLRKWYLCVGATAALAVVGAGMLFAGSKLSVSGYEEKIEDAFQYASAELSAESDDYAKLEQNLESAIEIIPTDNRAWLYLTRLYRSDGVVTSDEYSEMNTLLNSESGQKFQNTDEAYVQFCMQWGVELFLQYGSAEDGASGDPDKALGYLSKVVSGDEKEKQVEKLVYDADNISGDSCPQAFQLDSVSESDAENQYDLAECLHKIAKSYSSLGTGGDSDLKQGYSDTDFWGDLTDLANNENLAYVSNASDYNKESMQLAMYNYIAVSLKNNISGFYNNGVSIDDMRDMVESIREKADGITTTDRTRERLSSIQMALNSAEQSIAAYE